MYYYHALSCMIYRTSKARKDDEAKVWQFRKLPALAPCSKEGNATLPNRLRSVCLHHILLSQGTESFTPVTLYARAQSIHDNLLVILRGGQNHDNTCTKYRFDD